MTTNAAQREALIELALSRCPPDWLPVTVVEASFPPKHAGAMKVALLELEKDGRIEVGMGGNPRRAQVRRTLAANGKEHRGAQEPTGSAQEKTPIVPTGRSQGFRHRPRR